ncbi:hypothetical protein BKA66DRAFT_513749 [Pyrenochaeta sp. MPI-SDFR-AT-0127]|nr:hypothetical protein BKA66DRAFT_513749 [Pyrenochaeta sp. MPI-SDFR-AT-0127]
MTAAADFTTSYCSNDNTGSTDVFNWTWQSNGKCTEHCNSQGTFAFAVIQFKDCWCSNYIPAQQVDTSDCMVNCPGFPAEKCGDADKGLYIYIKLDGSPSGTQGGSQPTSARVSSATPLPSSTRKPSSSKAITVSTICFLALQVYIILPFSPPPVSLSVLSVSLVHHLSLSLSLCCFASSASVTSLVTPDPETIIRTVSRAAPTSTVYTLFASTSATPSAKLSTTLKTVSSNANEQPMTSTWVVTESGAVVTRTIIVAPTLSPAMSGSSSSGSNTGAIVGGVVGGVLGLLAIVGAVFFVLWRRRKQQREEQGQVDASGITRNTSTMSKAGLLGHTTEKDTQYPPQIMTNFGSGSQKSRYDGESSTPNTGSERRYSQPLVIDSRLDPRAVLTFHGANVSRESIGSIDDSRDYGRQLNVRNPDP